MSSAIVAGSGKGGKEEKMEIYGAVPLPLSE